jgi:hypothetical protein
MNAYNKFFAEAEGNVSSAMEECTIGHAPSVVSLELDRQKLVADYRDDNNRNFHGGSMRAEKDEA